MMRVILLAILVSLASDENVVAIRGNDFDIDISGAYYIVDETKCTVTKVSSKGDVVARIGGPGWDNDRFDQPAGIWARNGLDVFVADYGNHRIQRFDRDLSFVSSFSTRESGVASQSFGYPSDVALSRLGELYVCDTENSRIIKVDRSNRVDRPFGGVEAGKGRLHMPSQLAIGPNDNVFVLDDQTVKQFDSFGNFIRDLIPSAFTPPVALFADEQLVVVSDADSVRFYSGRMEMWTYSLDNLLSTSRLTIRSITFVKGRLYVLTEDGIASVSDPRL